MQSVLRLVLRPPRSLPNKTFRRFTGFDEKAQAEQAVYYKRVHAEQIKLLKKKLLEHQKKLEEQQQMLNEHLKTLQRIEGKIKGDGNK